MDVALAPRCFGSPTAYSSATEECRACQYASRCVLNGQEVAAQVTALMEKLGVVRGRITTPVAAKTVAAAVKTEKPVARLAGLTKNGSKLVERIKNIDILGFLRGGQNPFREIGPAYMRVVCDALLTGGFTRQKLQTACLTELAWNEGTFGGHYSFIIAALQHLDVIESDGDTWKIKELK